MLKAWLLLFAFAANSVGAVNVGNFSRGDLSGWEAKAFKGETRYRLAQTTQGLALCANSEGSASGLYRRLSVDLTETPYLSWSWRVDNTLEGIDETTREGDDYPARLYVIQEGKLFFWRTRSLVYVWSSHQPAGSSWESAYTGQARIIAVRSGPRQTGQWLQETRNVAADFERVFGERIRQIDAVALMTDTDNSGARASACYGDIDFRAAKTAPPGGP